ncbi:MAG: hypothetical protein M1820_005626 [Bogoriella megaspora]|nr:MAG: hypothetical protein M1820_005626 [Bogoriella megaspora]
MLLTQQKRTPRDPNKFPTTQLFLLALVRLAEPIALTSIFPYAWKLVLDFGVGSRDNASFYAGILISAFALAEAVTGMYWGGLSDRVGRKPVLLLGCIGTTISLLVLGFASNFWIALFGRALGGFLNGNIGVIQTMVGELVHNPEHEPKAFAVMPFVWSIGTIIGPTIGGYFANPADNFPSTFSEEGLYGRFPYLLPNLICAALLLVSIVLGYALLEETHPDMQPWSTQEDLDNSVAETPLMATAGATTNAAVDLRCESYGTFNAVDIEEDQEWIVKADGRPGSISSASSTKVFSKRVMMLIGALGIFTYHSMTYDHLLPIFFQDKKVEEYSSSSISSLAGGLGMSTQQVGVILSVNGLIALFIQAVIFPWVAAWLGVWKTFIMVTIGHPIAYFIVPYITVLPPNSVYAGIYACLTIRNFFSILAYPVILILIKEASPSPSCLGKINGLAASTGAAARTIASPIAGSFYDLGIKINFTALAWWISALVAIIGAIQAFFIHRDPNKHSHVRAAAPCRLTVPEDTKKNGIVHIVVQDAEEV